MRQSTCLIGGHAWLKRLRSLRRKDRAPRAAHSMHAVCTDMLHMVAKQVLQQSERDDMKLQIFVKTLTKGTIFISFIGQGTNNGRKEGGWKTQAQSRREVHHDLQHTGVVRRHSTHRGV